MTKPHRATPEQWAKCEGDARLWSGAFNCIIELRARIEALEAAQQKIRSAPESPLVERVADAIAAQATSAGIVNDRPARWGTPAIQPVPASESLPEPEDCDEQGRCWVFDDQLGLPWWTLIKVQGESMDSDMHWLPANALPTPEATS